VTPAAATPFGASVALAAEGGAAAVEALRADSVSDAA
jgi:hypothetical protein